MLGIEDESDLKEMLFDSELEENEDLERSEGTPDDCVALVVIVLTDSDDCTSGREDAVVASAVSELAVNVGDGNDEDTGKMGEVSVTLVDVDDAVLLGADLL